MSTTNHSPKIVNFNPTTPTFSSHSPSSYKLPTLYASFDVETDGPNASQNSMLSLGISFITLDEQVIDEVEYHIFARKDRTYDPTCLKEFWFKPDQAVAWDTIHQFRITPEHAMHNLIKKLQSLGQMYDIRWVAAPACFDWMFLKSYYEEFGPADKPNIGYYCIDMRSEVASVAEALGVNYKKLYDHFKVENPCPHLALCDARTQGFQYVRFIKWRRGLQKHLVNVKL